MKICYNKIIMEINVKIDSITNCLINRNDGKKYDTEYKVSDLITFEKAKELRSKGWNFDWSIPQQNGIQFMNCI